MKLRLRSMRSSKCGVTFLSNKERAMKRKGVVRERNQFVALALFRKAGSHSKTVKQVRQQLKKELSGLSGIE